MLKTNYRNLNRGITIILLSLTLFGRAQTKNKSGVSISLGIGYFDFFSSGGVYGSYGDISFINEPKNQTQINLNGDIAFWLDSYIFSIYLASGLTDPIPYKQANYSEYNLTVGKELIKNNWFGLEGHFGVGYFETIEKYSEHETETSHSTIGFPFRLKTNFYLNQHIAVGINPNVNLNLGQNSSIITINIIGQIKF